MWWTQRNRAGASILQDYAGSRITLGLNDKLFAADTLVPVERCRELDLPILLFSGKRDLIWPPAVLHELCDLLPNAQIVEIDSGHSPYFENAAAFNAELAKFGGREAPEQLASRVLHLLGQVHVEHQVARALLDDSPLVGFEEVAGRVAAAHESPRLAGLPRARNRLARCQLRLTISRRRA